MTVRRGVMTPGTLAEARGYGGGSQLVQVLHLERMYGTDGYRVLKLNNGQQGDGSGHAAWQDAAHLREADLTRWQYSPLRNTWTRRPQ